MIFTPTKFTDAWLLDIEPRGDKRGFFARTMCKAEFAQYGLLTDYVQQNTSFSAEKGTLRGLHFQRGNAAEAKLVRCLSGAILDAIVDVRGDSPTYLQHEAFELTSDNRRQVYVPPGFAHAYQTLTENAEVTYMVSAPYTPDAERGLRYDDPLLGIDWPLSVTTISDKDAAWPLLVAGAPSIF